ncbi:hypothetical protein BDR03DRAFT_998680 [Suillus americanus]|nr:hypothetical protein BDR03DRAFT_998680 [Suillus americanus]
MHHHPGTREAFLHPACILRRSVIHDPGGNRIAGTIDIIKHHTKLPSSINTDDVAGTIDDPESVTLLEVALRTYFVSYAWCLHPTDVLHKYTVHWFRPVPFGLENFIQV